MNDCGMRMRATWLSVGTPASSYQFTELSSISFGEGSEPTSRARHVILQPIWECPAHTDSHHLPLTHEEKLAKAFLVFQRVRWLWWLSNWNLFPAVPEKQREGLGSFSSKQQDPSPWHLALPWVRGLTQSFVSHALVLHVGAGLNGPFESLPTQNILCLPCLCVISGHGVEACPDSDARDSFRKPSQWEAITSLLPLLPCAITRLLLPLQQNQHDVP